MIKFEWNKVHRPDNTPIIRDVEIEELVEDLIRDYKPELLEKPMALNPEHFAEKYLGLSIDYQRIVSPDDNIVGAMVFNDECIPVYGDDGEIHLIRVPADTMLIHEDIANKAKFRTFMRFTMCHECGHAWLHGKVYRRNEDQLVLFGGERNNPQMVKCFRSSLTECRKPLVTEEDFREHQANVFAAAVAMPKTTFLPYTKQLLEEYGLWGKVSKQYVGDSLLFYEVYSAFLMKLTEIFDVSYRSAEIRLQKMGLIDSEVSLVS